MKPKPARNMRLLAALFAALMLGAAFVGCADEGAPDETTPDITDSGTTVPVTEEVKLADVLGFEIPEVNGKFNILYPEGYFESDFCADSFAGDEVSIEVYERTLKLADAFKLEVNLIEGPGSFGKRGEFKKNIERANEAGTYDYDMAVNMTSAMSTMLYSGLFADLTTLESLDLDHSWWITDAADTYGVNGAVYGIVGDIAHSYYSMQSIMALNTSLAEKLGVTKDYGDLYQLVYDGKWTLDKMLEIGHTYGEDVDGDQAMTLGNDVFGLVGRNVPSRMFMFGFGEEFFTRDDEDLVVLSEAMSERAVDAYGKLYAAFNNLIYPNIHIEPTKNTLLSYFAADRALMIQAYFNDLGSEIVRNMESDYMVLPMPKYDEAQTDYITPLSTEEAMVAVPITAKDPELTAKVMEYMGYLGEQNIKQTYIENTLKIKYADDPQVSKMMDFIFDRTQISLTSMFIWSCESINMRNIIAFGTLNEGTESVTSIYKSNYRSWKKQVEILLRDLTG